MSRISFSSTRLNVVRWGAVALVLACTAIPQTVFAQASARCRNTESFERWLESFRQEARSKGVSARALSAASPLMVYDKRIVGIDRGQRFFQQSFIGFADKLISKYRLQHGAANIHKHAAIFARVEKEFGVPAPVITAFWALESDFGANMGKDKVITSLTTLAYDCRRSAMFREQLIGALELIDRGDLEANEMIGSWAGEMGQTQFMPKEYMANAVDYDGNGKRNLLKSVPDVLGSTGKYLAHLGWRRGEPWIQEVEVPTEMPWHEADLTIKHPRSQWVRWGIRGARGAKIPADNLPSSLVLPMGRFGPAFLAYPNFDAYIRWNESLVYSLTAAYLATRLAGAPPVSRGRRDIPNLDAKQTFELQRLLARHGFKVGEIDGKIGAATRAAVRQAQMRFKLPADSYPTEELIERLR